MSQITVGRHPTLGEVLDYYARDSFIKFLIETCRVRRVVMVISETMHWEPNWTSAADDVFRARVRQATAGERWVVDGNYTRVRDIVYERLQMLVWLDYPLGVSLRRLTRRGLQRILTREDLWESGNRESFRGQFLSRDSLYVWAIKTHGKKRKRYQAFLADPQYAHITVVRLRSPRATEAWLAELPVRA